MENGIKDLKTVASFMLVSLALSSSATAQVNGNMIADVTAGFGSPGNVSVVSPLYGVPVNPAPVTPTPVNPLYGVPVNQTPINITPVNPLYGVPSIPTSVTPTPVSPLYGVPVNPTIQSSNITTVSGDAIKAVRTNNNIPGKNLNTSQLEKLKQNAEVKRDKDARTPVGYVAPVIIQYVDMQEF